jgi:hypothetical protein
LSFFSSSFGHCVVCSSSFGHCVVCSSSSGYCVVSGTCDRSLFSPQVIADGGKITCGSSGIFSAGFRKFPSPQVKLNAI